MSTYRRILRAAEQSFPYWVALQEEKCVGENYHKLRDFCRECELSLSRHGHSVTWQGQYSDPTRDHSRFARQMPNKSNLRMWRTPASRVQSTDRRQLMPPKSNRDFNAVDRQCHQLLGAMVADRRGGRRSLRPSTHRSSRHCGIHNCIHCMRLRAEHHHAHRQPHDPRDWRRVLIPASLAMLAATFDEHEPSHAIGIGPRRPLPGRSS